MRRAGGFTLIEVLVALAIVAVGMAAVLGAITSSAGTVAYLKDKTFAQWVALNQIANLRLSGQLAAAGVSEGNTDLGGRSWHWRQEVVATDVPGVMRIDVKVRPAEFKGDDDNNWVTTVSGIQGDSVGLPNGYQPDWGAQLLPGQGTPTPVGSATLGQGQSGVPGAPGQPGIAQPGMIGAPGTLGAPGNNGSSGLGGPDTLGGPDSLDGNSQTPGSQSATPPPAPPPQTDPDSPQGNPP